LSFLNQRDYLKKVWYQTIIGEEAFSGKQQWAFSAAADEELYKKSEQLVAQPNTKPYFLTLQTISSHQPRHSPYGDTVEDTFRYTDDQLGNFYDKLKAEKFFDNGLLIIISDHRVRGKPKQEIIDMLHSRYRHHTKHQK
jgi:phosphoglycerol transferase MdoB-like AlkP superfamily enzyme